jgi:hypothetical protein
MMMMRMRMMMMMMMMMMTVKSHVQIHGIAENEKRIVVKHNI